MIRKHTFITIGIVFFFLICSVADSYSQYKFDNKEVFEFQKRELNWGFLFNMNNEREETRTKQWREYEELTTGAANGRG